MGLPVVRFCELPGVAFGETGSERRWDRWCRLVGCGVWMTGGVLPGLVGSWTPSGAL